ALVSYERAKAEALGLSARGGLMERAERMILLAVGFLASWLLIPVLWVLLALVTLTAADRFVRVWRLASRPPAAVATPSPVRWGHHRVESRWRRRRAGGTLRTRTARTGEPLGRWRARRQESLASRSGRARRARGLERSGAGGRRRGATGERRP
ncbi:MAG TPA: hypothetical protein VGL60_09960, partial [Acidimicrobiales bacterium]